MAECRACGNSVSGAFCTTCGAPAAADYGEAVAHDPYAAPAGTWTLPASDAPAASAATASIRPGFEPGMFGTPISGPGSQYIGQWNWGAFLLTPYWLMNHRRPWRGILAFVIGLVPVANLIMPIAYGVAGNRVAVGSGRFADDTQFVAVQNAWRSWGFWITGLALLFFILAGGLSTVNNAMTPR